MLIILTSFYKLYLVISGQISNSPGDASIRAILTHYCGADIWRCLGDLVWSNHWPPGQFIFLGPPLFHLSGKIDYISTAITVSIIVFSVGLYYFYSCGQKVYNSRIAFFATLIYLGTKLPSYYSMDFMAESYGFAFIFAGLYYFLKYYYNESRGIFACAILFFFASLFRFEANFIAGFLFLIILHNRDYRSAFFFIIIAGLFTGTKLFVSSFFDTSQYLDMNKYFDFPIGLEALKKISQSLVPGFFSGYNFYIYALGFFLTIFLLVKKKFDIFLYLFCGISATYLFFSVIGRMGIITRFMLFPIAFFTIIVAANIDDVFLKNTFYAINRHVKHLSIGVFAILLIVISYNNLDYSIRRRLILYPDDVKRAEGWLRENLQKGDIVFFDFILFYESFFRSKLRYGKAIHNSFDYSSFHTGIPAINKPQSYRDRMEKISNIRPLLKRTAEILRTNGYYYLDQYQPQYIMVSGPALTKKINKLAAPAVTLRQFLKLVEGDKNYDLNVPGYPNIRVRFSKVFGNKMFEIYRRL